MESRPELDVVVRRVRVQSPWGLQPRFRGSIFSSIFYKGFNNAVMKLTLM